MYITQLFPPPLTDNLTLRRLNESLLLEDPVYRGAKSAAQVIVEYKLTQKQILDLFAGVEKQITSKDTGANRTLLGRGKDIGGKGLAAVGGLVSKTVNAIQSNTTVQAVDVAYDQATDALADMVGGQDGRIMGAIKKYRMLAKEYPKTAGLAKAALVTIAGLATGGVGAPAMAAFVYGLDSAIKGERASDIALKAGTAAALAWGAQKIAGAFQGGDTAAGVTDTSSTEYVKQYTGQVGDYGQPTYNIIPGSGGTYTVATGDQLGYIAQAQGTTVDAIRAANPDIDFAKALKPGVELNLPGGGAPAPGSVYQGYQGGMYGDQTAGPELLGGPGTPASAAGELPPGITQRPSLNIRPGDYPPDLGAAAGAVAGKSLTAADVLNGIFPPGAGETMKQNLLVLAKQAQGAPYTIVYDARVGAFESIKLRTLPAHQLIDQKLTTLSWALNESVGRPQGRAVHLTSRGINLVFENIQTLAELDKVPPKKLSPEEQARLAREQKVLQLTGGRGLTSDENEVVDKSGNVVKPGTFSATIDDPADPTGEGPGIRVTFDKDSNLVSSSKPIPGFEVGAPTPTTTKTSELSPGSPEDTNNRSRDQSATTVPLAPKDGSGDPTPLLSPAQLAAKRDPEASGPGDPTPLLSPAELAAKAVPPDLYRPDAPEAPVTPADPATKGAFGRGLDYLDRAAGKVGSALGTFGRQFTTKITKEKLKKEWFQAGEPSDTEQLNAFLVKQGVPQEAINTVYSTMGIPVTPAPAPKPDETPAPAPEPAPAPAPTPAPAPGEIPAQGETPTYPKYSGRGIGRTAGSTQVASGLINPKTGKVYTNQELRNLTSQETGTTVPTPTTTTPKLPQPTTAGQPINVTYGKGFEKFMKPKATTQFPAFGTAGQAPAYKTSTTIKTPAVPQKPKVPVTTENVDLSQRIAAALKQPVADMLKLVETKDDVRRIKQFIDQTFIKYNAVDDTAMAKRNRLIEHVTYHGALQRREHARKLMN